MTEPQTHHLGEDLAAMADDGRGLDPTRKEELDSHVGDCAECRAAIRSAKIVLRAVELQVREEPSESFDRALFERLDRIDREARAASPESAAVWDRIAAFFTLPRLGALAGATAAILIAVVIARGPAGDGMKPDEPALGALPAELAQNLEGLAVAEDLDLYEDLDVVEDLDVLDDLEVIRDMEDAG